MEYVKAFWYSSNNFGDNLNNYLIKKLSGKPCIYTERNKEHFIVCGSILAASNELTTVWGAGFGHTDEAKSMNRYTKILMVRGEETAKLLKMDFPIFGDPALLMPMFYDPGTYSGGQKKGIIPHWKDYEMCLEKYGNEYLVIDPFQCPKMFIRDVASCTEILSSGLHGLIISDAYKIPNRWIDFGTEIGGDGIKFKDYYSTTKTGIVQPITEVSFDECQINEYKFNLTELYNSCPFLK